MEVDGAPAAVERCAKSSVGAPGAARSALKRQGLRQSKASSGAVGLQRDHRHGAAMATTLAACASSTAAHHSRVDILDPKSSRVSSSTTLGEAPAV